MGTGACPAARDDRARRTVPDAAARAVRNQLLFHKLGSRAGHSEIAGERADERRRDRAGGSNT